MVLIDIGMAYMVDCTYGENEQTTIGAVLREREHRDQGQGRRASNMDQGEALLLLSTVSDPSEKMPEDRRRGKSRLDTDES